MSPGNRVSDQVSAEQDLAEVCCCLLCRSIWSPLHEVMWNTLVPDRTRLWDIGQARPYKSIRWNKLYSMDIMYIITVFFIYIKFVIISALFWRLATKTRGIFPPTLMDLYLFRAARFKIRWDRLWQNLSSELAKFPNTSIHTITR